MRLQEEHSVPGTSVIPRGAEGTQMPHTTTTIEPGDRTDLLDPDHPLEKIWSSDQDNGRPQKMGKPRQDQHETERSDTQINGTKNTKITPPQDQAPHHQTPANSPPGGRERVPRSVFAAATASACAATKVLRRRRRESRPETRQPPDQTGAGSARALPQRKSTQALKREKKSRVVTIPSNAMSSKVGRA